jgi:hypothetical protein
VAARLVRYAREWPGPWSAPERFGDAELVVTRPAHFFSATGSMPERAGLALSVPPGFASAEKFRELVGEALALEEQRARDETGSSGSRFLGVARVFAQHPLARPAASEPRRRLNPRVAARDKWKRIEALARVTAFIDRYRAALGAWRGGDLTTIFPAGTYLMRVAHGVTCAAP